MIARAVNIDTLPWITVKNSMDYIADNLRASDKAELHASTYGDPRDVVRDSWELSTKAWLILDETGLPIGAMGVAPGPIPSVGIAWMIGTDGVVKARHSIARQTRQYVEEMHEDYPVLWNYIDARNELSMRWLLWSGFHIVDADPEYGPERRLFFQFTRTP